MYEFDNFYNYQQFNPRKLNEILPYFVQTLLESTEPAMRRNVTLRIIEASKHYYYPIAITWVIHVLHTTKDNDNAPTSYIPGLNGSVYETIDSWKKFFGEHGYNCIDAIRSLYIKYDKCPLKYVLLSWGFSCKTLRRKNDMCAIGYWHSQRSQALKEEACERWCAQLMGGEMSVRQLDRRWPSCGSTWMFRGWVRAETRQLCGRVQNEAARVCGRNGHVLGNNRSLLAL